MPRSAAPEEERDLHQQTHLPSRRSVGFLWQWVKNPPFGLDTLFSVARMIPRLQTQISYEITERILLESDCSTIDEIQSNFWILLKIPGSENTTQHVLAGKLAHLCDIKLITWSLKAKWMTPQKKIWIPATCMSDPILLVTTAHSSWMQVNSIPVKSPD